MGAVSDKDDGLYSVQATELCGWDVSTPFYRLPIRLQ
jgi:hypothetical protein